jgi:hypothetical protein
MTVKARVLDMIDTFVNEDPVVREIAKWVVSEDSDALLSEDADTEAGSMNSLREQWPEASDEDILRGFNLSIAAAEALKAN